MITATGTVHIVCDTDQEFQQVLEDLQPGGFSIDASDPIARTIDASFTVETE